MLPLLITAPLSAQTEHVGCSSCGARRAGLRHCGAGNSEAGHCGANHCGRDLCATGCRHEDCELICSERDGWFDNLSLFVGLERSKQPQDFGVNSHLGARVSVNWAIPLMDDIGLGLQAGGAVNASDNASQVLEGVGEVHSRAQLYTTFGLFQRCDSGLVWAIVWDHLRESYYDDFSLHQFRGRVGRQFGREEAGLRVSFSDGNSDKGRVFVHTISLEALAQASVYWNHRWESGADTMLSLGVAESHSERNLAFELLGRTPQRDSGPRLAFGAEIHVPLNDRWALFGQSNFITPADTGTVDSYLGLAYYPGKGARRARSGYQPMLPVAGSTSFAVDLR